jgi:hypothetical protein
MTRSRILGLLVLLTLGFLILRSEDEPPDSGNGGDGGESATDRQLQPREPTFLIPDREYGIAQRPGPGAVPSRYGKQEACPQATYLDKNSGEYGSYAPYTADGEIRTDGYRFRPLDGEEQEDTEAPYPHRHRHPYATAYTQPAPYSPSSGAQRQPVGSTPYVSPPAYRDPQREIYSFRPLGKSSGARGRWQGPYGQPGGHFDRYPMDPWTTPPNPQWGAVPPSQRMYPNFYQDPNRRLTAR